MALIVEEYHGKATAAITQTNLGKLSLVSIRIY